MQRLFLSFFGFGFLRPAPGTWGSVAGALVAAAILYYASYETLFLMSVLLFLASIKVIDTYEALSGSHDDSWIVIDEVAGVWLAIALAPQNWICFILALILFRVFDIFKPSIIGRVDREVKGGLGVMGDDMLAGMFAGLSVGILFWIWEILWGFW